MKTVSVQDLKRMQDSGEEMQLIDVRELHEVEICHIDKSLHIPMNLVIDQKGKISKDIPVVVHCRSGKRSAAVVNALESMHGYENLHNLTGGILAWADEIDTSMEQY